MVGVCLVGVLSVLLIPCLRELGRTAGFLEGVREGELDLTLAPAVFAFLGCLLVEPAPDVNPFLLPVAFGAFLTEEEWLGP